MSQDKKGTESEIAKAINNLADALRDLKEIEINIEISDHNNLSEGLMRLGEKLPQAVERAASAIQDLAKSNRQGRSAR